MAPRPPDGRDTRREAREDDALLARVAGGDTGAWRIIFTRHLPSVTGCAWHMLHDGAEAEDVAQETFLRLVRQA